MSKQTFMRTLVAAAIALPMVLGAQSADAQTGRFVLEKTDDGYLRMDTETGEMSVCEAVDDQVVCKMAADERAAFQDELQALQDRVTALEAALETMPGGRAAGELPTEEEFERSLGYMERFMRRFMDIIEDHDKLPTDRT